MTLGMRALMRLIEAEKAAAPMYFVRATIDPEGDLERNFSCVYNAYVDTKEEIPAAIEDAYPDGAPHLRPPRQDPNTGWWCWEPEAGLSSFAVGNGEGGFDKAMQKVTQYGDHLGKVAVFSSSDFDIGNGADGEDVFRNGVFVGWLDLGASYDDFKHLVMRRIGRITESVEFPVTPAMLTAAIEAKIKEFIESGQVQNVRAIGDGLCYDFAREVFDALGADRDYAYGEGPSGLSAINTEDFEKDEWYIDLALLRKLKEPVPNDIPPKKLARLLGSATHQWIKLAGRHYDATAPHGVNHFLELPFFKNQIDGLRKEISQKTTKS